METNPPNLSDIKSDEIFAEMIAARIITFLKAAQPAPAPGILSKLSSWLKGKKTVIAALMLAAGPAVAEYLYKIDWQTFGISPGVAVAISAMVIALRAITTGPIGGGSEPNK